MDASVAIALVAPDEQSEFADNVIRAATDAFGALLVPQLWHFEVINALIVAVRRGRMDQPTLGRAVSDLAMLPAVVKTIDQAEAFGPVAVLAQTHSLTAYDASYLHLALREGAALATLDDRLRAAARAAGCRVFEPA